MNNCNSQGAKVADATACFPPRHMANPNARKERETAKALHASAAAPGSSSHSAMGAQALQKISEYMDRGGLKMTEVFARFDGDGSGEIDATELRVRGNIIGHARNNM